jgi:hypothetical protein
LAKERQPGKDEKPEDKTKLDEEFKTKLKGFEDKLAAEKKLEAAPVSHCEVHDRAVAQRSLRAARREEARDATCAGTPQLRERRRSLRRDTTRNIEHSRQTRASDRDHAADHRDDASRRRATAAEARNAETENRSRHTARYDSTRCEVGASVDQARRARDGKATCIGKVRRGKIRTAARCSAADSRATEIGAG